MKVLRKWWVIPLFIGCFFAGQYFYKMPKFDDGERSPNFEWTTASGETYDLKKLEGKYVLIDFWGSWCGPCWREFPGLKNLFEKYQNTQFKNANGFEIVGVGIEKEKDRGKWQRVIKEKGLNWEHQVFDVNTNFRFFNSKIAKLYGIKEVPTKYLLDEKGVVALVNPSIEQIDEFLAKQQ